MASTPRQWPVICASFRIRFTPRLVAYGLWDTDANRWHTLVHPTDRRYARTLDTLAARREFSGSRALLTQCCRTPCAFPRQPRDTTPLPASWRGSVSHCAGHSVTLVTHDITVRAIGVDLTPADIGDFSGERTLARFTTPEELERVTAYTPHWSSAQRAALLFAAKEATFKAAVQTPFPPAALTDIILTACMPQRLALRTCVRQVDGRCIPWYGSFVRFTHHQRSYYAVCVGAHPALGTTIPVVETVAHDYCRVHVLHHRHTASA